MHFREAKPWAEGRGVHAPPLGLAGAVGGRGCCGDLEFCGSPGQSPSPSLWPQTPASLPLSSQTQSCPQAGAPGGWTPLPSPCSRVALRPGTWLPAQQQGEHSCCERLHPAGVRTCGKCGKEHCWGLPGGLWALPPSSSLKQLASFLGPEGPTGGTGGGKSQWLALGSSGHPCCLAPGPWGPRPTARPVSLALGCCGP